MKIIKVLCVALVVGACLLMIVIAASSFSKAFTQVDTLITPVNSAQHDTVKLLQLSEEKTRQYNAVKDSVSENIDFGDLKTRAVRVSSTLNKAASNLREVKERDLPKIDKTYRIDTSPRPVIINVNFPSTAPAKAPVKRGLFNRRD